MNEGACLCSTVLSECQSVLVTPCDMCTFHLFLSPLNVSAHVRFPLSLTDTGLFSAVPMGSEERSLSVSDNPDPGVVCISDPV